MAPTALTREQYLDHLARDIEAMAAALEHGPLDAPVPWCGRWTLADLGAHLGGVHRWATGAVRHQTPAGAEQEAAADPAPQDPASLAPWLRDGGVRLLAALHQLDLDGPTWHPFPIAKVGAVWPRRQAQEAAVHRWDAEHAIGAVATIDPALAADGIDEYFFLALPRLIRREGVEAPAVPLLVRTTDTEDRWLVGARDGTIAELDGGDAATELVGAAQDVLLTLWRRPVTAGAVTVSGATSEWLDLGGM